MSNENIEFNGHCAFAISTGKTEVLGGSHSIVKNGKKYLFSNIVAKYLFMLVPNSTGKAEKIWENK